MEPITGVVLAVGTTHPLNIAGLGLDARVASALGIRLLTIVAGISAQSAGAVLGRTPVDAHTIDMQFASVRDVSIGAIHVGALLDADSVAAVARGLALYNEVPIICDPVIATTSGDRLADDATIAALRDGLFARCTLVTPNLDEAGILLGRSITDVAGMENAAHALRGYGAAAVLVKGGHLADAATDVLVTAAGVTRFSGARIPTTLRGTGDLFACAIAARLACGDNLISGIATARHFVRDSINAGVSFAGARTLP